MASEHGFLSPHMPGFPVANLGRPAFAAEARALFARFTTPPSAERKVLINNLIKSLVLAGVWAKLDAFYVMAAADSQAARRNWIADQYNLTAVASPTFTADRGYQGDGTSSYLSSAFTPSTAGGHYALNSASMFSWSRTATGKAIGDIGVNNALVLPRNASDQIILRINSASTATAANADGSGLTLSNRTTSNASEVFRNGVSVTTTTNVSDALASHVMSVVGRNANGSFQSSSAQIAVAGVGGALSGAEITALYNHLTTYLTAIGAV